MTMTMTMDGEDGSSSSSSSSSSILYYYNYIIIIIIFLLLYYYYLLYSIAVVLCIRLGNDNHLHRRIIAVLLLSAAMGALGEFSDDESD